MVLGREEMKNPGSVNNLKNISQKFLCAKYTEETVRKHHKHGIKGQAFQLLKRS
jgi:hypothetical protein